MTKEMLEYRFPLSSKDSKESLCGLLGLVKSMMPMWVKLG